MNYDVIIVGAGPAGATAAKFISEKGIDALDDLPFPAFYQFELDKYTDAPKSLPILTSRGCPYACICCSRGLIMGSRFRPRSPENILAEIQHLMETHGTRSFSISDDNLTFDVERAKEICRGIIASRLKIKWNASNGVRVNHIDEELVGLMKASGCREIAIGVESIRDSVLGELLKGTRLEMVQSAIRLIRKHRIRLKGFFLIGSPSETSGDVRESLEFALRHFDAPRFRMLTPYPGTRLWQWVDGHHYWTVDDPLGEIGNFTHIGEAATMFETPWFRKEEKEAVYREVYRRLGEVENKSRISRPGADACGQATGASRGGQVVGGGRVRCTDKTAPGPPVVTGSPGPLAGA